MKKFKRKCYTTEAHHNIPYIKLSPCENYLAVCSISNKLTIYNLVKTESMTKEVEYDAKEWIWNAQWLKTQNSTTATHPLELYYLLLSTNKNIHLIGFRSQNSKLEAFLIDKIKLKSSYDHHSRLYLSLQLPTENVVIYITQFSDLMTIVRVAKYQNEVSLAHESFLLRGYVGDNEAFLVSGFDGRYCEKRDVIVLYLLDHRGY